MSRKILTQEAKERLLLNFFRESGEFYSIKEIESTAAKKTGINSMQIKNVLKVLTDSSLVRYEKIGSGNYYWSFPSDAKVAMKQKIDKLTNSVSSLESEISSLQCEMGLEEKQRIPSALREEQLGLLNELKLHLVETKKNLAVVSATSPQAHAALVQKIEIIKAAINKHTDNINEITSYLRKLSFVPLELIQKEFGFADQDMEDV